MSTSFIIKEMSSLVDYISFHEVELTDEKFSYGVMVKDRLVFEYFGSYCRDNQILIQACILKDLSRVEVSLHLFLFFVCLTNFYSLTKNYTQMEQVLQILLESYEHKKWSHLAPMLSFLKL